MTMAKAGDYVVVPRGFPNAGRKAVVREIRGDQAMLGVLRSEESQELISHGFAREENEIELVVQVAESDLINQETGGSV
jgi:hypothetical protein